MFQEGKRIEREYYIIAVYDDPGKCTVTFAAYELETDKTFTLPYTYSEIDDLFRFNSELMNPNNKEERYHWVIERLDFMLEDAFHKKLCLAAEATVEVTNVQEVKKKVASKAFHSGKIDATTRAKLLAELDTMDDTLLQNNLVNSENVRKQFLQALHACRRLEQQKALQRISLIDDERSERTHKLEENEKKRRAKKLKFQQEVHAQSQAINQLEVLMRQKEQEAVRALLNNKDKENRDRDQRHEQSMHQRKMREKSWKDKREQEIERGNVLKVRRADQQRSRDDLMDQKNREIMQKRQRDIDAKMRLRQQKQESASQAMEAELEAKQQLLREEREKLVKCEMLDLSRAERENTAILKRNLAALEEWTKKKEAEQADNRRREKEKEQLKEQNWQDQKVAAKTRAVASAQVAELNELREDNIALRDDMRLKRQQDAKWMREREESMQVVTEVEDEDALRIRFEAEERDKRRQGREQHLLEESRKTATIFDSNEKFRNQKEAELVKAMKEKEYAHRAKVERNRMEKEQKEQKKMEEEKNKTAKREANFFSGEKIRDCKEAMRAEARHARRMSIIQALPEGTGLCIDFIPY